MSGEPFDFNQRVVVRDTYGTRAVGNAGWHGEVVGISREGDDPAGQVLAYAVAMDEDGKGVWMVEPDDLEDEAH